MRLKPLSPFFFGGEQTFGADKERKEIMRYRAESTLFPQQSALLGMLRKTLLIDSGLMTLHRNGEWVDAKEYDANRRSKYDEAKKLVGSDAFSFERDFDMGAISSLSPLFIQKDGRDFTLEPIDSVAVPTKVKSRMKLSNSKTTEGIFFENYDPKVVITQKFISNDGTTKTQQEIFQEVESVGIQKSTEGETKEDKFFMKQSYQLKDNALFVAIVELSKDVELKKCIVSLGADQSPFMLTLEECDVDYLDRFSSIVKPKPIPRVVALSDMLLSKEAYEKSLFVWGSRQIQRTIERDESRYSKIKKSHRYYILSRGSVIYSEDTETLKGLLDIAHLKNIGLNHYLVTQGEK